MRHRSRMAHQRLHPSKSFGQCEYLEAAHQFHYIRIRALELKRNHVAEATHLTFSEFIIGMGRQTRIIHLLHSWVLSEKPCDRSCILFVLALTYSQRLNATQCQP